MFAPLPYAAMPSLHFRVKCETVWGEQLVIAGSHPLLGNWNPCESRVALTTTPQQYPWWTGSCELPSKHTVEFKFVAVLNGGPQMRWESNIGNRLLDLSVGPMEIEADFNQAHVGLRNIACNDESHTPCKHKVTSKSSSAPAPEHLREFRAYQAKVHRMLMWQELRDKLWLSRNFVAKASEEQDPRTAASLVLSSVYTMSKLALSCQASVAAGMWPTAGSLPKGAGQGAKITLPSAVSVVHDSPPSPCRSKARRRWELMP